MQVIKDHKLRERLGARAKESVRRRFLMPRLLEDWFGLITSFETTFRLR